MVTRFYCPLRSCPWTYDDGGPDIVFASLISGDPELTATLYARQIDDLLREHMERHSLEEWVREVAELRAALNAMTGSVGGGACPAG